MDDTIPAPGPADLDSRLIAAAMALIAEGGWCKLSLAEAARRADLPLAQVRARFPFRATVLLRFNTEADKAAITGAITEGPVRDRLFDIVMRRIDSLQAHRAGVKAVLRHLPRDPLLAAALGAATLGSMEWLLDATGIDTTGLRGRLRIHGMHILWLATLRAWEKDETADLAATMSALDAALTRAEQAEASMADLLGGKTATSDTDAEPV
jgi:AcrR family transcriptional regulator